MKSLTDLFMPQSRSVFPLKKAPLIQCITNEITCESMANALLYIDAKPVMADDIREFEEFISQSDGLLLNLGHISEKREKSLLVASKLAAEKEKPVVIDLVGVAATKLRQRLAAKLSQNSPNVVKGNISELRSFCGLENNGRGVDGSSEDQNEAALHELARCLQEKQKGDTVFLATGPQDLVVTKEKIYLLANGVDKLDRFTGTGDIVGAIIAALLGEGLSNESAVVLGVSYFNICGEKADVKSGLADFRQETLNQLSLLMQEKNWFDQVKGHTL